MREIKFRAWDKVTKRILEVVSIDFNKQIIILKDEVDEFERRSFDSLVLLQFTGLKDKNGKEIYEGDIIKSSEGFRFQVHYGNGEYTTLCGMKETLKLANWLDAGNELKEYAPEEMKWFDVEVIGNIYENEELIKNG